jgi:hypothetical protein
MKVCPFNIWELIVGSGVTGRQQFWAFVFREWRIRVLIIETKIKIGAENSKLNFKFSKSKKIRSGHLLTGKRQS